MRITGFEADLVLEVNEGSAGYNAGGSASVDAENPSLLRGFTVREPFLLQLREDLQRNLAELHNSSVVAICLERNRRKRGF